MFRRYYPNLWPLQRRFGRHLGHRQPQTDCEKRSRYTDRDVKQPFPMYILFCRRDKVVCLEGTAVSVVRESERRGREGEEKGDREKE